MTDVIVVGAGVVGSAVAYYCAKRGLSVTLIDQPKRGRATSASAGGLWPLGESLGIGCGVILARNSPGTPSPPPLPREFLEFALASNAMFPPLADELREKSGIDIEFERSSLLYLMYDETDEAYAERLLSGHPDLRGHIEQLSAAEVAAAEPALTRRLRGALRFVGDDQVNPYRTADALRGAARACGARVMTHTEVLGLVVEGGRVAGVETRAGRIGGGVVVNAAGAWAPEIARTAGIDLPVHPVRGQILASEALPELLHACISTSDCYLAQKAHGEIIAGSTTEKAGFDASVTPDAMRGIARGAVRALPALADVTVKRAWSGFRPGTPDELPILGPVDGVPGYLNACGHFRTGILTAPLTGLLLAEIAAGVPPSHPVGPYLFARFAEASTRPLNPP